MEHQQDILTEIVGNTSIKRSKLLPWWIKIFMWIFLVISFFVPVLLVLAILGFEIQLAIYGLDTNRVFTFTGLLLVLVFATKGVVSFGFIKEKDWAVQLAMIDAIAGIIICVYTSYIQPLLSEDVSFSLLKLELVLLIPYLVKLNRIKEQWASAKFIG
ncbi:hypothetical protein IQ13_2765 [Lacibacter cauensis]|uniref:Uncharacterized protein n=1 Tax=Lacibacter cauensis TaxID=510947 RepID=A0A562SM72_9BACT|nr:hypothetical protein [Lacibacter cauensis]TWI81746.1 hypothetical protein IQ13_2765 [Lacibacter cauensis]